MIVKAIILPPSPSLLPLQLTSLSVKDKSPLYGAQRALLGNKAAKNATALKMHKDRYDMRWMWTHLGSGGRAKPRHASTLVL